MSLTSGEARLPERKFASARRTGFQLVAKTDANGDYSFENVKTGNYILEVNASGFAAITSEEIQLEGDPVTRDFRLSVASVNENVVVIAAGIPQRADEVSKAVTILEDQEIET